MHVAQQAAQDVFAETGKEQPHVLHLHDLAGHTQNKMPTGAYRSTQKTLPLNHASPVPGTVLGTSQPSSKFL